MEQLEGDDVAKLFEYINRIPLPDDVAEQRKARAKWEAMTRSGEGVFVSSQFADVFGKPVSMQMDELKRLLRQALTRRELAIVQQIE